MRAPRQINRNDLAKQIAAIEGGCANLNIAEIKEVLRIALAILATEWPMSAVVAMLEHAGADARRMQRKKCGP